MAGAMSLLTATLISTGLLVQDTRDAIPAAPRPNIAAPATATAAITSVLVLTGCPRRPRRLRRLPGPLRMSCGTVTVSFDREPGGNARGQVPAAARLAPGQLTLPNPSRRQAASSGARRCP